MKHRTLFSGVCLLALAALNPFSPASGRSKPEIPLDNALEITIRNIPLAVSEQGEASLKNLQYRGGLILKSDDKRFGGFSSLIINKEGTRLLSTSDRGMWFTAQINYKDGWLTGLEKAWLAPILKWNGKPLAFGEQDAEALAFSPANGVFVAFEGWHRIWHYQGSLDHGYRNIFSTLPHPTSILPNLENAPSNAGIEALTMLSDGRLLAVTENLITANGHNEGWLFDPDHGKVEPIEYVTSDGFRPTDFAVLPNGDVLSVERHYSLMTGPSARLSRIARQDIYPGARLQGKILDVLKKPMEIDNMEGIAIRQDDDGTVLIYLISDDNYSLLQRTLLLMFELRNPG